MLDIYHLSEYEENNRIEVKRAKDNLPVSVWETYSSFANTDGGIILLGVVESDDHKLQVTGVTDPQYELTANPARTSLTVPANAEQLRLAGEKMAKSSGLKVDSGGLKVDRSGLSETARAICELLDENPNLTYDEIAARLEKARSGIAKHIKRLKAEHYL